MSCHSDKKCDWVERVKVNLGKLGFVLVLCWSPCTWDLLPLSLKVPTLLLAENLNRDACEEWLFCVYPVCVLFKCLVMPFVPWRRNRNGGQLILETADLKPWDIAFGICKLELKPSLVLLSLTKVTYQYNLQTRSISSPHTLSTPSEEKQ